MNTIIAVLTCVAVLGMAIAYVGVFNHYPLHAIAYNRLYQGNN